MQQVDRIRRRKAADRETVQTVPGSRKIPHPLVQHLKMRHVHRETEACRQVPLRHFHVEGEVQKILILTGFNKLFDIR